MNNLIVNRDPISALPTRAKDKPREAIRLHIEEYLAGGNVIEIIPARVSKGIFEKVSFNSNTSLYAS